MGKMRALRDNAVYGDSRKLASAMNASDNETANWCEWWSRCTNEATTTEPHPILGEVPICGHCQALVRSFDA